MKPLLAHVVYCAKRQLTPDVQRAAFLPTAFTLLVKGKMDDYVALPKNRLGVGINLLCY